MPHQYMFDWNEAPYFDTFASFNIERKGVNYQVLSSIFSVIINYVVIILHIQELLVLIM